jgi:hypothetical protein
MSSAGGAQQGLDIEAFGHGIGRIPLGGLVLRHTNTADRGPDAHQFLDDGRGIARTRFIVIGPDGDCLDCQWHPVGFVDGRGGTAHGGGGRDAQLHQGIGTFFTFDQHHGICCCDGRQVVERTRFRHSHGPRSHIPRAVLLAAGCVVPIHAGQQAAIGRQVIPFASVGAKIVIGTAGVKHWRSGDARHHQPIARVFQQLAEIGGQAVAPCASPQRQHVARFAGGEVDPHAAFGALQFDHQTVARLTLQIADVELAAAPFAAWK